MNQLPSLLDLVPKRNSTYNLIFVAGLVIVLTLGGLYLLGIRLGTHTTDGMIAAFDLDAEGSIACWFSVVAYFLCGLTTLLVRKLRMIQVSSVAERRAWGALAALWFTMSLDEGASLHEGFKELMTLITGTRIIGDGSIYWVVPYFLLLSAGGLFLLWKARRAARSIVCLFAAGASFALAVAGQMDLVLRGQPHLETWMEESCEMMGQLFLLLSLALYTRNVANSMRQSAAIESSSTPLIRADRAQHSLRSRAKPLRLDSIPTPHPAFGHPLPSPRGERAG